MDTLTPNTDPESRTRSRLILVGFLVAFVAVIGGSLWIMPRQIERARMAITVSTAKTLYTAIATAGTDRTPGGIGYPAESGAKTTHDYLTALQDKGYINIKDYPLLFGLVLANTSEADPRDTVLFVSRAGYVRYVLGKQKKLSPTYFVYHLDGTVETFPIDVPLTHLPTRTPTFLEP
ncbi:hypothetical protein SAMN05444156_1029 [Verrucomicrobium sp. GAS474]|uniref:hypothetical protein n=1 Tax=Verrucomicrobium sp. GAS474 TaxID=1882831 RepID=UPI00087BC314|nr:hypothetical protein [Verrucomicrobium sp. GAS474]SDT95366.1 hypothetical protein SAMN05444156_1029 [Verrucomicrobium sp. GAS474]